MFNERYLEVLQHYGIEASKHTLGNTHENGDVESAHRHFKRAMDQRLRLRGMRGIASLEQYEAFLHQVVPARNPQPQERLTEELAVMRPLPVRPLPAWREDFATVTRWSTVRVARKAYSVKQDHPPAAIRYARRRDGSRGAGDVEIVEGSENIPDTRCSPRRTR